MPNRTPTAPEADLAILRSLSRRFRDADAVTAEIARLSAELALPKGSIHVVGDVHGEDVKLRHVINNASGTLRPLVDHVFAERPREERQALLTLLFYPVETLELRLRGLAPPQRRTVVLRALDDVLTVVRTLASR